MQLVKENMGPTAKKRLEVTRADILNRGLANRCPNCGNHSLFPPHSLFVRDICPVCELPFDQGRRFRRLGPWLIDYALTAFYFVVATLTLSAMHALPLRISLALPLIIAGFAVPVLLYRNSWSWWLMLYFLLFPHKLPANGVGIGWLYADDAAELSK